MIQKGTTKADAVKKLLDMADDLTVKSSLVLLDRGFHSTDTIHAMNNRMAEREKDKSAPPFNYIIQCARTPSVVKALDEHEVGNRPAESEASIVGGIQIGVAAAISTVQCRVRG